MAPVARPRDPQGSASFGIGGAEARRFLAATNHPGARAAGAGGEVPPFLVAARSLQEGLGHGLAAWAERATAVVHVHHEIRWHGTVAAGAPLAVEAGIGARRSTPGGTVVEVHVATRSGESTVVDQRASVLLVGVVSHGEHRDRGDATVVPRRTGERPVRRLVIRVERDQAQRYAAVVGDLNPIHLDDAAARRAGLPRAVLHGMCTLALVGQALEEASGRRLAHIAARFGEPVLPGEAIAVQLWAAGDDDRDERLVIEATDERSKLVLRRAYATLAPGVLRAEQPH